MSESFCPVKGCFLPESHPLGWREPHGQAWRERAEALHEAHQNALLLLARTLVFVAPIWTPKQLEPVLEALKALPEEEAEPRG